MEVFLAEYGLSTDEGIALMCLAEALLRVPDAATIDALIEDKIAPSDWARHLGRSTSTLVNASTWGLLLTGRVLDEPGAGLAGVLRGALRRLGEPVIRAAVARAMREMGAQFVLGETIESAMQRAERLEEKGYTYSYDMLGEAARTESDARRYQLAYADAITALAPACRAGDIRDNPGLSVKLSALFPRYEVAQRARVLAELVPRVRSLAGLARAAGMGFNIDAEEADRLTLSLEVIEAVLSDPSLAGWDGFGVVVQAYGPRAAPVLDWLEHLAERLDRRLMVRLVKGAYWDAEIKRAQVLGLDGFPVFTDKAVTDANYLACARRLLDAPRLYPQFATHNAHSVAAILDMAGPGADFEFQRLHGMGERLHQIVQARYGTRCRIYAPVGTHRDLLAYLVRRLLENGANSSFVNQIVNPEFPPEEVARDPFSVPPAPRPPVPAGPDLFAPERKNSHGFDLSQDPDLSAITTARSHYKTAFFEPEQALSGSVSEIKNPADLSDYVGNIRFASEKDIDAVLAQIKSWNATPEERARVLVQASELYESNFGRFFALLAREAGKCLPDAVSELREAVDFLRYYAARAPEAPPLGVGACISPWNFPLAIFTGQIAAALAAGNGVLAKPAEQTGLIAAEAVRLLHQAGVPPDVLQLLPGDGPGVGAALTSDARIDGVLFTGSTETARQIRTNMARHMAPGAPLVAETGGINAMVVDSTALPEQAVRDVIASAFQSAGQRCSALRCLYVQEDIAPAFTEMLTGAMDELRLGDPWELSTDIGPLIDAQAHAEIAAYVEEARAEGRVIHELAAPKGGHFLAPVVIRVDGIHAITREVFGPVLHLATFAAGDLDRVLGAINATGYGLTFGLHSRIDDRVQAVVERIHAGNIYVNRNQIGAVVGSQPFGGEGLSGTGPKAGGPLYLSRLTARPGANPAPERQSLPGPTGEMNRLTTYPRAPFLCLGPGEDQARAQQKALEAVGGQARLAPDLEPAALTDAPDIAGALWWGDTETGRAHALALAARPGPILPLVTGQPSAAICRLERSLCVDTTASGGNAALIAQSGQQARQGGGRR
ncbi:MAG TPA: bifunctional proline dehydrogenase/L-glutamate gamma-semialdehyde dehydrogenase PutA, partial [Aliiroseovarius sp.]|nr:bifunctional proline dehydrogenase/L-glutamate gamma-semialdehyde dehydrogenase PutA [Aliiroseovarius sp.]